MTEKVDGSGNRFFLMSLEQREGTWMFPNKNQLLDKIRKNSCLASKIEV